MSIPSCASGPVFVKMRPILTGSRSGLPTAETARERINASTAARRARFLIVFSSSWPGRTGRPEKIVEHASRVKTASRAPRCRPVLERGVMIGVATGSTTLTKEDPMAGKADALAKQFEAKVQEATGVLERLSDADWKKTTASEKWTVGVVAHHMAGAHEGISNIVKAVAAGQSMGNFTMQMLHDMNAKHAQEHAGATKRS